MSTHVDAKGASQFLKVLTITSSSLLALGVISYRVGAFDYFHSTPQPQFHLAPAPAESTAQKPVNGQLSVNPIFMSGSKSPVMKVIPDQKPSAPNFQPQSPPPSPRASTTFMSGSKSLGPIPVVPAQPQQQQAGTQSQQQQAQPSTTSTQPARAN